MKNILEAIENCDIDKLNKELKQVNAGELNMFKINNQESLLHYAIKFCGKEVIKSLITGGMNINIVNSDGYSILELLALYNDKGSIEYCINLGAKILNNEGYTLIHWCATHNEVNILKKLLETNENIDIDMKDFLSDGEKDCTALHWAAQEGNIPIARVLFEKGADINAKNASGQTALIISAAEGNKDFVKFLLDLGADINIKDNDKNKAKDFALIYGYLEVALLLEKQK